jgi:hypothetical protein
MTAWGRNLKNLLWTLLNQPLISDWLTSIMVAVGDK